ncbi:MAG: enoyl-CoA hydratase [Acidimicrobiales bacterium]
MTIHYHQRGPVALVTLDRPERRNALDHATLDELATALDAADAAGTRALVLSGAGGHFCAGADLSGVEDEGFSAALRVVLDALHDASFVTMAAIDGAALGAGLQLAVACDLRVATPAAKLGIPAGKLGLCVDHWTVQRVALLAGHGPARAILLAAEVLSGDDAVRLGLVQRAGYLDAARLWAKEIAALAPLTVQAHKLMLNRLEAGLTAEPDVAAASARAWASTDLQEGLAAFRDRRPPTFTGQ